MLTAVAAAICGLIRTLILGIEVPRCASVMVAILLVGGLQLTVLGIIGDDLGRVFEETKIRPL